MITAYKILRQDLTTYNGFKWEPEKHYKFSGNGELCDKGFAHAFPTPELAELLWRGPIPDYDPPALWEVGCDGVIKYDGEFKLGASEMWLIRPVEIPVIPRDRRVEFAVCCVIEVYPFMAKYDKNKIIWRWLNGDKDISAAIAAAYADRADRAARGPRGADWAAADAAVAAAYAAIAADRADRADRAVVYAAWASWAAARAAAWAAARAAAGAAAGAAAAGINIPFIKIAKYITQR